MTVISPCLGRSPRERSDHLNGGPGVLPWVVAVGTLLNGGCGGTPPRRCVRASVSAKPASEARTA